MAIRGLSSLLKSKGHITGREAVCRVCQMYKILTKTLLCGNNLAYGSFREFIASELDNRVVFCFVFFSKLELISIAVSGKSCF